MKKIVITFFIFIACFGIYLGISKEDLATTFSDTETSYSMYILTFPNKNISTNNFEDYFNNFKVVWIEPYINDLYKTILQNYKVYQFEDISVKSNINRFKNNYVAVLENSGYRSESLKYKIDGVIIERTMIYCTDKDIERIINKIENVQVEKGD